MVKEKSSFRGWLIALIAIVAVLLLILVIMQATNASTTGYGIFDFLKANPKQVQTQTELSSGPGSFGLNNQSNQTNCTDTDGGIYPYIYGKVIYEIGNLRKIYPDYCWTNGTNVTNSSVVAEFYCQNNFARRTLIYCPGGCSDGKCLNVTAIDISPGAELDSSKKARQCEGARGMWRLYPNVQTCKSACYGFCDAWCYQRGGPECAAFGPECQPYGEQYNCDCTGCSWQGSSPHEM